MRDIVFTKDLHKKYPCTGDLFNFINLIDSSSEGLNDDEYLRQIEFFLEDFLDLSNDIYIKQVLLGECCIPHPINYDDWTEEELNILDSRISIISDLCKLSRKGFEDESNSEG